MIPIYVPQHHEEAYIFFAGEGSVHQGSGAGTLCDLVVALHGAFVKDFRDRKIEVDSGHCGEGDGGGSRTRRENRAPSALDLSGGPGGDER